MRNKNVEIETEHMIDNLGISKELTDVKQEIEMEEVIGEDG